MRKTRSSRAGRMALAAGLALALAGCDESGQFSLLQPKPEAEAPVNAGSTRLVERDVEAPDVFQVTEAGLWDGRPSLGGVWVAHPEVAEPERVIIRNQANGKFVIGALFRRERENPGPRVQVSSDAAAALGMLAGAPAKLNVTALRREEVAQEAPQPAPTAAAPPAPAAVTEQKLDPVAGAAAAIDKAEKKPQAAAPATAKPAAAAAPAPAPKPQPKPKPKPRGSSLSKPWLQIGIFSVEANAKGTADKMRKAGMVPTVHKGSSQGKTFWRVVVGPASSKSERDALLKQIKAQGFADAYPVTN